MPEAPDLSIYDESVPYYDRTPRVRAIRATLVKFVNGVGTHLICPRRACQREGGCADRDMGALQFCWKQHRGMLRFLLLVAAKRLGVDESAPVEGGGAAMPEPFRGEPLLAHLASNGADLDSLRRSAADGPDDWDWEAMPEMRELFNRLTAT